MYQYNDFDQQLIDKRAVEFDQQARRYFSGALDAEQFRPLRLMNGFYLERHAPMLRVAIPYGVLHARQLRRLAFIAREYDRGYGHFTTRQNVQFNWPALERGAEILAELAKAQLHAIQASGNCVRNVTSDHLAGVAADEIEDPRPYAELIRQWSTVHPEFVFLPRKFKIAVTGSRVDRAASRVHDIGLRVTRARDETGFEVLVGGGLGRSPFVGQTLREFLPREHLLTYLEAMLRVYNMLGRRDNKYKARIKILVKELGIDAFRALVEDEWEYVKAYQRTLSEAEVEAMRAHFRDPEFETFIDPARFEAEKLLNRAFADWVEHNTVAHRRAGYRAVYVSLKRPGHAPGDLDADGMEFVADLAERHSFGEVRVAHTQNLVLPHVPVADLPKLWKALSARNLATPNIGMLTDVICCPGMDYCSLANTVSIPVAEEIGARFADLDKVHDVGPLRINISGCMNACGHHHVGHVGILGVDKKGEEWFQITLGGDSGADAALGRRIGPALPRADVADAVERIVHAYLDARRDARETFLETLRRLGPQPFKEAVYGAAG